MQKIKELYTKYRELIVYGICGLCTVVLNLILYRLLLFWSVHYVISSVVSYIAASFVAYYLNLFFVFKTKIGTFKNELKKIGQYFLVRIGSVILDTFLLILMVELLHAEEFFAKIIVSVFVIVITFLLNRKILKN